MSAGPSFLLFRILFFSPLRSFPAVLRMGQAEWKSVALCRSQTFAICASLPLCASPPYRGGVGGGASFSLPLWGGLGWGFLVPKHQAIAELIDDDRFLAGDLFAEQAL